MSEKDKVFSNKIKYRGVFSFPDFYQFAYDWLRDETGLLLSEDKYKEKLMGDSKNLEIEWTGRRDMTDYFRFELKVIFRIIGLVNVEVMQDGKKIKTNKAEIEIKIEGSLIRDYKSKFEKSAVHKFMRAIYEKSVIAARVEQFEVKIIEDCNEFLSQVKAYLDLEGKR
ncbi:MAG TPA: hypothetical protein VJ438_03095 [Candidatus Nanoarchaeia archaeon]|nr:hypothetical protein [Candidatus Nanoarchaeia archaeon]